LKLVTQFGSLHARLLKILERDRERVCMFFYCYPIHFPFLIYTHSVKEQKINTYLMTIIIHTSSLVILDTFQLSLFSKITRKYQSVEGNGFSLIQFFIQQPYFIFDPEYLMCIRHGFVLTVEDSKIYKSSLYGSFTIIGDHFFTYNLF
ncbi:hypothetical protein ACJX0J_031845, partial [Zea mays]